MSNSGMGRDVHSLVLSIQHFLYRPQRRPPFRVPRRMVLERLSWRVTCPNHANLSLESCQKTFFWTHKAIDLAPRPVVGFVPHVGDVKRNFLRHWFRKPEGLAWS